jgi:hypothetical protein
MTDAACAVMGLPAVIPLPKWTEADVVDFGYQWFVKVQLSGDFGDGVSPLHRDAGYRFLRRVMKRHAMSHPFAMDDVIKLADAGWHDAHLVMCELIAEYNTRPEVPPQIRTYTIKMANPNFVKPTVKQKKSAKMLEDLVICTLIMTLIEEFPGLRLSRNDEGRKLNVSAFSAAAAVMTRAGRPRGEEGAMKKIWDKYSAALLPGTVAEQLLAVL